MDFGDAGNYITFQFRVVRRNFVGLKGYRTFWPTRSRVPQEIGTIYPGVRLQEFDSGQAS
jgi:hypothetical protein